MEAEKDKITKIGEDQSLKYLFDKGYKETSNVIGSCIYTAINGLNSIAVYSRIFFKGIIWEPKETELSLFIQHSPNTEIVRLDIKLSDDYLIEEFCNVITYNH